jgi:hypothetical protein
MMDTMQDIKRFSLEAQVIRADGTIEDLGIIALYDKDPEVENIGQIRDYGLAKSCE